MSNLPERLQEEKILRTLRARRRLRAMIKNVMHNMYWLIDDYDKVEEVVDEKEAIKRLVTRQTRQSKPGALTIKEKAILRKHPDWRTDAEKHIINKYLGGLRCFRRYPEDVQYKLVAVSYFEYFGPNRVLVRQNHEAQAMYFILSGEVAITREVFDEFENKWVTQELGKNGVGSMFGEVSLLHGMKRSATATTLTPCEFLTLKKEDFNNVLKQTIQTRWDEIRMSMKNFNYFDYWDEITISECCILSKLKTYEQNQVILGDGVGKSSQAMVYFVVEGKCSVVEHLFVTEKVKRGIKTYELYKPQERQPVVAESIDVEACVRISEKPEIITISNFTCQESDETEDLGTVQDEDDENIKENDDDKDKPEMSNLDNQKEPSIQSADSDDSLRSTQNHNKEIRPSSLEASTKSPYPTITEIRKIGLAERTSILPAYQRKTRSIPCEGFPEHVKIRFMQVCTLSEKSTFSNNNMLDNRRVIALTPVKCILIPTYWLTQHNKGNVWTRVMNYINWRMPTHEQVFRKYVAHKKWIDFKKKLVSDVLHNKKYVNHTTIHDVPYSIRVMHEEN